MITNADRWSWPEAWRFRSGLSRRPMRRGSLANMVRFMVAPVFCTVFSGVTAAHNFLYSEKCAGCHAVDGSGHTNAATKMTVPDLRSKVSVRGSPRLTFSQNRSVETEVMAFRPIRLTPSDAYFLASFLKTIERTQAGFTPFGRGFDRGMHFHIWLDADSLEF